MQIFHSIGHRRQACKSKTRSLHGEKKFFTHVYLYLWVSVWFTFMVPAHGVSIAFQVPVIAAGWTSWLINQNLRMAKTHNVHLDSKSDSEAKDDGEFPGYRSKSFGLNELVCSWISGWWVVFSLCCLISVSSLKLNYTAVILQNSPAVLLLAIHSGLGLTWTGSTGGDLCVACFIILSHGEALSAVFLAIQQFFQAWTINIPRFWY